MCVKKICVTRITVESGQFLSSTNLIVFTPTLYLFVCIVMSNHHAKNEIDYIMTDKPSMATDVTVINRVNIGSDHRMVMGSITLNTRAERRKLLNKNTRTRVDTQMIGTKKNTFQLELKKQIHSTRRT